MNMHHLPRASPSTSLSFMSRSAYSAKPQQSLSVAVPLFRRRSPPRTNAFHTVCAETSTNTFANNEAVQPAPPKKLAPGSIPKPVPVRHSSAFAAGQSQQAGLSMKTRGKLAVAKVPSSNALEAALRTLDDSLDEFETTPSPAAKAAWAVGKMTESASRNPRVQAAARGAVEVGTEAMKAAIPVGKTFGQWALKNAIKVASSIDDANKAANKKAKPSK
mmetsp:Transcript_30973/g.52033  ORF Transcript_30973/g.52033 Transcript_30973/m.52033 type:complete len:218 (-) Transcript_30973:168-821(-)|eukprot:CAMPEP_0198212066 /NCGR_PEP_ID=MMETSP1445-20131203/25502_1 /TAXON_ID=36898 /ORGANISM="Pyramimonas sp., Strain CCMP2087" /LENGTH=217 /DNA_ID=CAMNT_0043886443 /DNA_START=108 /DNA_END=761 /DNA_ORIENTATION=-